MDMCTWLLLGRPAQVLRLYEGGRDPDYPDVRVMLAAACLAMGQDRRALRLVHRLVDIPVPRGAALSGLIAAVAAARLGQPDRARLLADQAVRLIDEVGLLSAVRYLTAESQQVLLRLVEPELMDRVRAWCELQGSIQGAADAPALTAREREILSALGHDLSVEEIAHELGVSRNTVKTLISRLYRKLGVNSREAANEVATQLRLV